MPLNESKESFDCDICNSSFARKYNLQRHLLKGNCNNKINMDSIMNNSIMPFDIDVDKDKNHIIKCSYCKKLFDKKCKLNRHLLSTTGNCYNLRMKTDPNIINKIYKKKIYDTINNNQTNINIGTIRNVQPVIKEPLALDKHGEETISHITKDVMMEILNIESFPKMCAELMRLLYFNKEVPENKPMKYKYKRKKINQNMRIKIAASQTWKCNHCK